MEPNLQPQSDPLAEAMARRGVGVQQAPMMAAGTSAPAAPAPQAPLPAAPIPAQPEAPAMPAPAKFEPANKEDFIISTLAEELKRSHDLKKEQMKFSSPQQASI